MFRHVSVGLVLIMALCVGCKKPQEEVDGGGENVPPGSGATKLDPSATMMGPNEPSECFAFSPDGKTFVSGARVTPPLPNSGPQPGDDHTLFLWNAKTGEQIRHLAPYKRDALAVCFSEDGKNVFVANTVGCVRVDTSTGETVATVFRVAPPPADDPNAEKRATAMSASTGLVALSHDKTIDIWNLAEGKQARVIPDTHEENANLLKFSNDGKLICSASLDGKVKVWEVDSGKQIAAIDQDSDKSANGAAFSPDNKTLALSSIDTTHLRLIDIASGEEETIFADLFSNQTVAFSPDGKILASGGQLGDIDKTGGNYAKLWNAETRERIATLDGFPDGASFLAFSPDGKTLVGSCRDGKAFLWDVSQYVK